MSIAITEDHRALADTVGDFLTKREARSAARALLEAEDEPNAAFYGDAATLGWLGLHVPEEHGGSGYGLEELVVVVEQLGRAVAPGAFVPTVVASAVLAATATGDVAAALLPGLVDGSKCGAVALGGDVELRDGALHGSVGAVIGAGLADVLLVGVGDDVAVVERSASGVSVETPQPNRPPSTPRSASSSAARSRCSRRSSITAPTCWWPPSWRRRPCGTQPGRRRPAVTSSR
jgi:alkylation response protein AidB-like acyl-CoA dehydrogenase